MLAIKYGKASKIIFTGGKQDAKLFMHYGDNDAKIMFNVGEFQRQPERNEVPVLKGTGRICDKAFLLIN